jgi:hypothetical protein
MSRNLRTLLAASTMVAGLAATPALYARDSGSSDNSVMGSGMMGQGMMNMMGQMSGMMERCGQMMQAMGDRPGAGRPNEQWQDRQPEPQHRPQHQGRSG